MSRFFPKVIFFFVVLLIYCRIFLSVDLGDEGQYLGQADGALHFGGPFSVDLFIQQVAVFPILPLVKIYQFFNGNEAIYLFFRHLYLALALLLARSMFVFLKENYQVSLGWVGAACVLAFIPCGIPSWSYNTITYVTFPIVIMSLFGAREKRMSPVITSLIGSIGILSYPPIFVGYGFAYFLQCIRDRKISKDLVVFLLSFTTIFFSILLFSGKDSLLVAIEFTRSFGALGGVDKFGIIIKQITSVLSPAHWLTFFALTLSFTIARVMRLHLLIRYFLYLLIIGFTYLALPSWCPAFHLLMPLTAIFLGTQLSFFKFLKGYSSKEAVQSRSLNTVLFLLGIAALLLSYSSSNGFPQAAIAGTPLLILLACSFSEQERLSNQEQSVAGYLYLLPILICALLSTFSYFYHDGAFRYLDTRIKAGPMKYLYSQNTRVIWMEKLRNDLDALAAENKTIFIVNGPAFYLFSRMRPQTKMLYIFNLNFNEKINNLIVADSVKEHKMPDVVLTIKDKGNPTRSWFEDFFLEKANYSIYHEDEYYRINQRYKK